MPIFSNGKNTLELGRHGPPLDGPCSSPPPPGLLILYIKGLALWAYGLENLAEEGSNHVTRLETFNSFQAIFLSMPFEAFTRDRSNFKLVLYWKDCLITMSVHDSWDEDSWFIFGFYL